MGSREGVNIMAKKTVTKKKTKKAKK